MLNYAQENISRLSSEVSASLESTPVQSSLAEESLLKEEPEIVSPNLESREAFFSSSEKKKRKHGKKKKSKHASKE